MSDESDVLGLNNALLPITYKNFCALPSYDTSPLSSVVTNVHKILGFFKVF